MEIPEWISSKLSVLRARFSSMLRMFFRVTVRLKEWLFKLAIAIWHGSVRWAWFAVLLAGAFGMTSTGEYGGALFVVCLAAFSLGSKYWHWFGGTTSRWRWAKHLAYPFVAASLIFSYFWVNSMRGDAPWSHIPQAWNSMLIAFAVRVESIDLSAPPPPRPPTPTQQTPNTTPVRPKPYVPPPCKPEVELSLVHPDDPAVSLHNISKCTAMDIKWGVVLFDTTNPAPDGNPLQIPVQSFDFIKTGNYGGPEDLFRRVASQLKPGDVLDGTAFVDCPNCVRGHSYLVQIVWKSGGWYWKWPQSNLSGNPVLPTKVSADYRRRYFAIIDSIPPAQRIAIEPQ